MPRNLDHRIEVVAPIEDARAREEVSTVLDSLLADNTAWQLSADGSWHRLSPDAGTPGRSTHQVLMRRARLRARRRTRA
jgi:polyphosphate kinase